MANKSRRIPSSIEWDGKLKVKVRVLNFRVPTWNKSVFQPRPVFNKNYEDDDDSRFAKNVRIRRGNAIFCSVYSTPPTTCYIHQVRVCIHHTFHSRLSRMHLSELERLISAWCQRNYRPWSWNFWTTDITRILTRATKLRFTPSDVIVLGFENIVRETCLLRTNS